MESVMRAIEVTGYADEHRQLHLDDPLSIAAPARVRAIILIAEPSDLDEQEWLYAAARNPAFDFLKEPSEDIYTLADGVPFSDAR